MSRHKNKTLRLERFLPYRLSVLTNRVSGIIADTYRDKFALSVTEWRVMAVLGEYPGSSANEVSEKTRVEKSIISRAINKLLRRNLVERVVDPRDRRRSALTLGPMGASVYEEIVPLSYAYERKLLACFTPAEQRQFDVLIGRLYEHAGVIEAGLCAGNADAPGARSRKVFDGSNVVRLEARNNTHIERGTR